MNIVSLNNISKKYGSVEAVKNISFDVSKGEIFGLIGPDGAGKTTIFRIITTLLLADSGTTLVQGLDVVSDFRKIRNIVGYMPGKFSLYQDLTVEENLQFFATVFQTTIEQNYHLIEEIYTQLEPFKNRRAGKLSGGMKQKLALCCALIHQPEVLFLDEPTTGVDAVSRKEFWEMLGRLKEKGMTILVSTPYMDEAVLCDRIGLIQKGEMLRIDSPKNIIDDFPRLMYAASSNNMSRLLHQLREHTCIQSAFTFGATIHFTWIDNTTDIEKQELLQLIQAQHQNFQYQAIKPTIEDCFIDFLQ
jgi:ABC-2 type transport system ATP-binding protein